MSVRNTKLGLFLLMMATVSVGCGGGNQATRDDITRLEQRIADLERNTGRSRIRLDEVEERVFLLQDRVEAQKIAIQRVQTGGAPAPGVREYATIQPRGPYSDPVPSAAAPPSWGQAEPHGRPIPELPVQQLGPAGVVDEAPAGDEEEIVINQDAYEAYVRRGGGDPGGSAARVASPPTRGPLPPVVTNGDRLPVAGPVSAPLAGPSAAPGEPSEAQTPLAIYKGAVDLFNQGKYGEALAQMNAFVQTRPEADYMDNAYFWIGECYYGMGRYDDAIANFQRVVSEYPDGNKVPDSLLKVALTWERLNRPDNARQILRNLAETYPKTDAARRARERLRDLD